MAKGLALQFKQRFPENFRAYAAACQTGEVKVGRMFVTRRETPEGPRWIINFPTKQDWRHPSRLEWVESGLHDLRRVLLAESIRSVAPPNSAAASADWIGTPCVRSSTRSWVIWRTWRWWCMREDRAKAGLTDFWISAFL